MSAKPKLSKNLNLLKEDASKVLDDIAKINRELVNAGSENISEYSAEIQEKLSAELEVLRERLMKIEKFVAEQAKYVNKHVKEHPYPYIAGSLGLGLLLGKLIGRKG